MCLDFDGLDIQGVIENISLNGALIKLTDTIPNNVHLGDNCDLLLCTKPYSNPVKYTSKVA
jgi:hypothetical protein